MRRKPVAVFRSTCLARNSATSASVAWASRARSVAQHLGERVAERPWLKQLDDVSIGHGVSLLCWRSGGSNTPTKRRLLPVRPSPTSAYSSGQKGGRSPAERSSRSAGHARSAPPRAGLLVDHSPVLPPSRHGSSERLRRQQGRRRASWSTSPP